MQRVRKAAENALRPDSLCGIHLSVRFWLVWHPIGKLRLFGREGIAYLAIFHGPFTHRAVAATIDSGIAPDPCNGDTAFRAGIRWAIVPQVAMPAYDVARSCFDVYYSVFFDHFLHAFARQLRVQAVLI